MIYDNIKAELKDAMKNGNNVKRDCLRSVIDKAKMSMKEAHLSTDSDVISDDMMLSRITIWRNFASIFRAGPVFWIAGWSGEPMDWRSRSCVLPARSCPSCLRQPCGSSAPGIQRTMSPSGTLPR